MDMEDFEIHQPRLQDDKKLMSTMNRADITLFTSPESKWRATRVQKTDPYEETGVDYDAAVQTVCPLHSSHQTRLLSM